MKRKTIRRSNRWLNVRLTVRWDPDCLTDDLRIDNVERSIKEKTHHETIPPTRRHRR